MRQFHCNRKWTTNKPFGRKNIYVFGANIDYIGLEDARRWTNRVRTPAGDNQLVLRGVCLGPVDGWRDSTTYANNTLFDNLMS